MVIVVERSELIKRVKGLIEAYNSAKMVLSGIEMRLEVILKELEVI